MAAPGRKDRYGSPMRRSVSAAFADFNLFSECYVIDVAGHVTLKWLAGGVPCDCKMVKVSKNQI